MISVGERETDSVLTAGLSLRTVRVTGGTMKDERSELLSGRRHKDWRGAKQTEQFSHVVRAQVARSGQQSWSPSSSPGQQENRRETGGDYINKQPVSHGDFYLGKTSHHQVHHSTVNLIT